jgi:DNA primase
LAAIPYAGGSLQVVYEDVRARVAWRAAQTVTEIAEETGQERLAQKLTDNPEIEALFLQGVEAATRTGLEAKRRLLGRIISAAVLDDAKIEEAQLRTIALRDLEAPHIRALERIARAMDYEQEAIDAGEGEVDGVTDAFRAVVSREPAPVIETLLRTGLITSYSKWLDFHQVGRVTEFGRALLDDLRACLEEQAWRSESPAWREALPSPA